MRSELDATLWWPFDPGLECDVWTQFSNSIGHTLPAAAAALFVGLTTTRPAARPDRATPTNSGNFLHLRSPRGLQGGADTIAPNGILTSLLFFSNWVPLPSEIASALIFGTLLHTLVEIGQQPWCDKHEKTSESWIFIASEGLRLRLKAKHQSM